MGRTIYCSSTQTKDFKMTILVTGATGFVGQNIIPELLKRGHSIIALARDESKARAFEWYQKVIFIAHDIYSQPFLSIDKIGKPDALLHLAWSGLPNYQSLFHFEKNLYYDYIFLKLMVEQGINHLIVTGTCLEYGMQNGCLSVDMITNPNNPYALAKDTLRKFLQNLQKFQPFTLQWTRLFYLYGHGQNVNSLISQLDKAIDSGETIFNMSKGDQLRDYLPINEAANQICDIIDKSTKSGIFNICSGEPTSVRSLVEKHIAQRHSSIQLNLGYYPYNNFEPKAFWGAR